MIMIPQSRYNELLKLEARVDVLFYLTKTDFYVARDVILSILRLAEQPETVSTYADGKSVTTDDLSDALQYTD